MFINDKLTNLMTKFFCKFFKIQILVKTFLTLTVFILFGASSFLSLVEAQTTTTTPSTTSTTLSSDPEPASPSCSIYDTDWGISYPDLSSGFSKGLYGSFQNGWGWIGGLNTNEKNTIKNIYNYLKKDPIFLTQDSAFSAEDPILGMRTLDPSTGNFDLNTNEIKVPCLLSGTLNGLIARRGTTSTKFSNCTRISGNEGNVIQFQNTLSLLCQKDAQLATNVAAGCSLEMMFVDNNTDGKSAQSVAYNNLKKNVGFGPIPNQNNLLNTVGLRDQTDRETDSHALTGIRLIYSPGAFIKKTITTNDPQFAKTISALRNYPYAKDSTFTQFFTGLSGAVSNNDFTYSTNGKDTLTDKQNKFMLQGNTDKALGGWFNTIKSYPETWTFKDTAVDKNSLDSMGFSGLYYNNETSNYSVSRWIDQTSFECRKRDVKVTLRTGGTELTVPIYEWIPSSFLQLSAPTCSSVGAGVSKIIPQPSAIAGKHYLVCTPCVVPAIFQTDIFGQPVFGIPTSIGCLPSSINGIISVLIRIASITAGGLAVLIITISGMRIMLNTGDPEEVKKAQKAITSAIVGLLVIISSVFLLNLIGVKILDLSSFGGNELEFKATSTS